MKKKVKAESSIIIQPLTPDLDKHLPKLYDFFKDQSKFRKQKFRSQLVDIYIWFDNADRFETRTNADGVKYPTRTDLKKFIDRAVPQITKQVTWLRKNYAADLEIGEKEDAAYLKKRGVDGPGKIGAIYYNLVKAQIAAAEMRVMLSSPKKHGPKEVFKILLNKLIILYEFHSKKPATSINLSKDDPRAPSDFQNFVRACYIGFGEKPIKTFDAKVNKALRELRPNSNKMNN